MFGRKRPQSPADGPPEATSESTRTSSYRLVGDAAPATTGAQRTTSYVSPMQNDGRGYETLN